MKIVLSGSLGRMAIGGYAWMDLQWLLGLAGLGHDVTYVEDCGEESWVYDWEAQELTDDIAYPSGFVRSCLEPFGLAWMYRAGDRSAGMRIDAFAETCREADLLIVHAVPLAQWRPEYLLPSRRAFVDVDPGFTQVRLAQGDPGLRATVDRCDRLFTIAQRLGRPDCRIPINGHDWVSTVPPLSLPHWPARYVPEATHFTTVMQWRGHHDLEYEGMRLGQKDAEFPRFLDVPRRTKQPFRIALSGAEPELLSRHGWEVVPGWEPSRTPSSYQSFIHDSRAEFSVAKQGYVASRAGWFSDRSICYLASAKPVLVQDTGLEDWLPVGQGVVTFRNIDDVLRGVEEINADYEAHSRSARKLAEEVFASELVLPRVLEAAAA